MFKVFLFGVLIIGVLVLFPVIQSGVGEMSDSLETTEFTGLSTILSAFPFVIIFGLFIGVALIGFRFFFLGDGDSSEETKEEKKPEIREIKPPVIIASTKPEPPTQETDAWSNLPTPNKNKADIWASKDTAKKNSAGW